MPALMPVFWNLAIIIALVVFVPRFDSDEAKLYVYAGGILAGTVILAVTPVWWLRGHDGRIRAVLDLRDPAVKRVFVLMLPVTLGVGLINFNLRHQHALRLSVRRPGARAERHRRRVPHLHAPAGDVLRRRRDGALPARSRASPPATTSPAFGRPCRSASARSASSFSGERRRSGARGPDRAAAVPARRVRRRPDARRRRCVRGLCARADLQRDDADAQPGVLQPPVAWVPTAIALGNLALNVALNAALYRFGVWGIPLATSIVNIAGTAALLVVFRGASVGSTAARSPPPTPASASPRPAQRESPSESGTGSTSCSAARSARRSSRWASALLAGSGRLPRLAALLRVRELQTLLSLRRRSATTSENELARPHPQLLHRGAHRPRQVDAGRPHPRGDADALRARDARAGARLDGARARARHHDQGAGRARHVAAATSST